MRLWCFAASPSLALNAGQSVGKILRVPIRHRRTLKALSPASSFYAFSFLSFTSIDTSAGAGFLHFNADETPVTKRTSRHHADDPLVNVLREILARRILQPGRFVQAEVIELRLDQWSQQRLQVSVID